MDELVEALRELGVGYLVVVTGAGVSLASGIPTFRGTDPDAVWKHDVLEMATFRFFLEDPVESWRWYLHRFDRVADAEPNPAHGALVALERWHATREGRFLLVTQNVDTLHRRAGSRELVEVHGRADRVRCPVDGCRHGAPRGSLPRRSIDIAPFRREPSQATLPRCPACDAPLRQHVLWFDELYSGHEDFQWERVQEAANSCDLLLFVGTSFAVGVTDLFVQQGLSRRVPIFSVDPGSRPPPVRGLHLLAEKAEDLLPAVCEALKAGTH